MFFNLQLLLDAHSLKTVLQDLPSLGSQVGRKAPSRFEEFRISTCVVIENSCASRGHSKAYPPTMAFQLTLQGIHSYKFLFMIFMQKCFYVDMHFGLCASVRVLRPLIHLYQTFI